MNTRLLPEYHNHSSTWVGLGCVCACNARVCVYNVQHNDENIMKKIIKTLIKPDPYDYYNVPRYIETPTLVQINVSEANINLLIASKLFVIGFSFSSIVLGKIGVTVYKSMKNSLKIHKYSKAWKPDINILCVNSILMSVKIIKYRMLMSMSETM